MAALRCRPINGPSHRKNHLREGKRMSQDDKTVGLMGTAQAKRLLAAGFQVVGFDPAADARERLAGLGGRPLGSVAEVARTAPRVVLAVFDTTQVEDVLAGPDGVLSVPDAERKTRLAIVTSTCEPDRVEALAGRVAPLGLDVLEVPLSGTSASVETGDAVGLVGGPDALIARAEDMLAAICPRFYRMGAVGNGGRTKLAVNCVVGLNRAALAEGLVLAERMGLPLPAFFEAARGSAAYSQIMDTKGRKMVASDFEAQGRIRQSHKDFTLITAEAANKGQQLPMASAYLAYMKDCIAAGEAEWDNAAVIEAVRRKGAKRD
jgi:3-hydroxyisobutyrate dehydrogenase-like beta-hydroxyacid dehydrogenase